MNLQKIALNKGKEAAGHNVSQIPKRSGENTANITQFQSWTRRRRRCGSFLEHGSRCFAADSAPKKQLKEEPAPVQENVATSHSKQRKKQYKSIDRVSTH